MDEINAEHAKWLIETAPGFVAGFVAGTGAGLALAVVALAFLAWKFLPGWMDSKKADSEALSSMAASVESHEAHTTRAVSVLTDEIRESRKITKVVYQRIAKMEAIITAARIGGGLGAGDD